ncbi:MAG: ABC transporter ATP-binding protein [Desulfocapsa sp.]|jgi:peptide/nickel transport system ATP-binding protein|nr:ABC transporter ATP-binding protein [Desulfocapsa sp.]
MALLEVKNLEVSFALRHGDLVALDNVSFTLDKKERLGIVGESGAGKSVTGFSVLNLISKPGKITKGEILFEGQRLDTLTESELRHIRGNRISMIFQDPMMTLNPVLTIGTQMVETLLAHRKISRKEAEEIAIRKLELVHIPSPERRLSQYPHEFSGGMRQRIIIAIALITDPSIIIADEPTTALDVTIQAEIMDLLQELCASEDMGLLLITHDLGVVAEVTERVLVMYAGKIVEMAKTRDLIASPLHPYSRGLINALPGYGECDTENRLQQIPGSMPNLTEIAPGCSFHPRCDRCQNICKYEVPKLRQMKNCASRFVSCHFAEQGPVE